MILISTLTISYFCTIKNSLTTKGHRFLKETPLLPDIDWNINSKWLPFPLANSIPLPPARPIPSTSISGRSLRQRLSTGYPPPSSTPDCRSGAGRVGTSVASVWPIATQYPPLCWSCQCPSVTPATGSLTRTATSEAAAGRSVYSSLFGSFSFTLYCVIPIAVIRDGRWRRHIFLSRGCFQHSIYVQSTMTPKIE